MITFALHFIAILLLGGLGLFLIESLVGDRWLQMALRLALVAGVVAYLAWVVLS